MMYINPWQRIQNATTISDSGYVTIQIGAQQIARTPRHHKEEQHHGQPWALVFDVI